MNTHYQHGYFSGKTIRVQNGSDGSRGGGVERWVASNAFEIEGSGFYITNE